MTPPLPSLIPRRVTLLLLWVSNVPELLEEEVRFGEEFERFEMIGTEICRFCNDDDDEWVVLDVMMEYLLMSFDLACRNLFWFVIGERRCS